MAANKPPLEVRAPKAKQNKQNMPQSKSRDAAAEFEKPNQKELTLQSSSMTKGTWCSGITPAQHAGGPGFNPQCVYTLLPSEINPRCKIVQEDKTKADEMGNNKKPLTLRKHWGPWTGGSPPPARRETAETFPNLLRSCK